MSIYLEKKDNGWRVKVIWYENGKQRTKSKQGFRTKTLARQYGVELENARNKGHNIGKDPLFVDYFQIWYETFKKPVVSDNTKHIYLFAIKSLKKYFPSKHIKDITRWDYQRFINDFATVHALSTVKHLNTQIRSCVQSAIADGLLSFDFTYGVSLTGNDDKARKVDYLNLAEIHKLLHFCYDTRSPAFVAQYLIATAILTGARIGELAGLTWQDLTPNAISINKQWDYVHRKITTPKTATSNRVVSIPRSLYDMLLELKSNGYKYIFQSSHGRVSSTNINKSLRNIFKKLGINRPGFSFHSLRHSHVAYLLSKGFDLYTISKRLGHADISITSKTYAYLLEEYKQKVDEQICKALDEL